MWKIVKSSVVVKPQNNGIAENNAHVAPSFVPPSSSACVLRIFLLALCWRVAHRAVWNINMMRAAVPHSRVYVRGQAVRQARCRQRNDVVHAELDNVIR